MNSRYLTYEANKKPEKNIRTIAIDHLITNKSLMSRNMVLQFKPSENGNDNLGCEWNMYSVNDSQT